MQVCMNCFQELFDSDTECVKCKSKELLSTSEYNECKKFFMHHEKDLNMYTDHPYNTYLKYLRNKNKKEQFEYDRLHPSYSVKTTNLVATEIDSMPSEKCIPKCPTCNSTNIHKISVTSKVVNTALFGILGTKRHKTFHCDNCGYEW